MCAHPFSSARARVVRGEDIDDTARAARRHTPANACALRARPPAYPAIVCDDPRLSRRVWDTRDRRLRRRRRTGRVGSPCVDKRERGDRQS